MDAIELDSDTRAAPNRSVYNLIYDSEDDDDNLSSHSSRSYLEEDDLPLPQISDSESNCTQCGECPDCCEVCARSRKRLPKCKCGWVKNVIYYTSINGLMILFFCFVMYMSQVNYYQNPDSPPFKQLLFKPNQYPGMTIVPSMYNLETVPVAVVWYATKGNDSATNRRPSAYVKYINDLLYEQGKSCLTASKCILETDTWGPCEKAPFGYNNLKPCLFLKLNRLTLWLPEEYYDPKSIPKDVPSGLRKHIDAKLARIWVHCKGATIYDEEKIGEVSYHPGPYFPSYYFPIDGQRKNNPMIAIQLPNVQPGYVVLLQCGMYAKNLHIHDAFHTYIYIKD